MIARPNSITSKTSVRRAARHEHIHLQLRRLMNEIGDRTCANGPKERVGIDVEFRRQRTPAHAMAHAARVRPVTIAAFSPGVIWRAW